MERHGLSSPIATVDRAPTGELRPMAFLVGVSRDVESEKERARYSTSRYLAIRSSRPMDAHAARAASRCRSRSVSLAAARMRPRCARPIEKGSDMRE